MINHNSTVTHLKLNEMSRESFCLSINMLRAHTQFDHVHLHVTITFFFIPQTYSNHRALVVVLFSCMPFSYPHDASVALPNLADVDSPFLNMIDFISVVLRPLVDQSFQLLIVK